MAKMALVFFFCFDRSAISDGKFPAIATLRFRVVEVVTERGECFTEMDISGTSRRALLFARRYRAGIVDSGLELKTVKIAFPCRTPVLLFRYRHRDIVPSLLQTFTFATLPFAPRSTSVNYTDTWLISGILYYGKH